VTVLVKVVVNMAVMYGGVTWADGGKQNGRHIENFKILSCVHTDRTKLVRQKYVNYEKKYCTLSDYCLWKWKGSENRISENLWPKEHHIINIEDEE
jgi:hypothetical protein